MRQARAWSKALSAAEIEVYATKALTGSESGLLADWPLDDGAGQTARDIGPNHATLGLLGSASWTSAGATPGAITSVTVAAGGTDIAQNAWIVIKGTNLVPNNTPAGGVVWSSAPEFASGRMPTQLGGYPVTVTVNNQPAYLYFFCSAATSEVWPATRSMC